MDPGEGDGHQLQECGAVALFQVAEIVEHPPLQGAGSFGFVRGQSRQCQGCESRIVVGESRGPTLRTPPAPSRVVLAPVEGFQRAEQGSGVAFQVVDGREPARYFDFVTIQTVKLCGTPAPWFSERAQSRPGGVVRRGGTGIPGRRCRRR